MEQLLAGCGGERPDLAEAFRSYYQHTPFVTVQAEPPALKHVIDTNRCRLSVRARDQRVVVLSAIDNLTKGAAGGALQWMNRRAGRPAEEGLEGPGLGWH